MVLDTKLLLDILIALGVALVISFAATPVIKAFAQKVGALDVPREARRMHDHPIPRMGGLAIFLGFISWKTLIAFGTPDFSTLYVSTSSTQLSG